MSQAWMDPVVVWKEPRRAVIIRVGIRAAITVALALFALAAPWVLLQGALAAFSYLAALHTGLAVANRIRSKGAVLRLMGSGTIEWHQSIQEKWLKRPVDWADGTEIRVLVMPKFPVYSWVDPRVTLLGATHKLENLPLYGTSAEDFMATANAAMSGRGVTLVPHDDPRVVAAMKAARLGTRRPPSKPSGE